ncbi:MAG: family 78 glycoside hydrolase catalytic domain [Bacillota bacterium]|nr:family 78 glycoside hydrolase catalytic domain [Bacillota bacterium]
MNSTNNPVWQAKWISAPDAYLETLGRFPGSSLPFGSWIWPEAYSRAHLISSFQSSGNIVKAMLEFQCDNEFDLYLNNQPISVMRIEGIWVSELPDVSHLIHPGENHIAVRGYLSNASEHFLSAIRGVIQLEYADGHQEILQTDKGWKNAVRGGYWQNYEPEDWQTTPLAAGLSVTRLHPRQIRRSCLFRHHFQLDSKAVRAVVHVTARGLYALHINGKKVGQDVLTPDASKDLVCQQYDVTDYLTGGNNVIAAITGNGWYNSEGWGTVRVRKPELLVQLTVTTGNGTSVSICTDGKWKVIASPLLEDDIQFGERYDARQDIPGWDLPETDTDHWFPAEVASPQADYPAICQDYEPIRIIRRVRPEIKRKLPDGNWLFDFGKNTSGRVCLKVRGANSGDRICIRMYERLDHAGDPVWGIYSDVFYHDDNAPGGKAAMALKNMDVYICRGGGEEVYEPRFTYTGFRYACIEGYPGEPGLDDLAFMVIHTDLPQTGYFTAGSKHLSNICAAALRAYQSNIHGGPTDCPTREKNFWNGDIQAFAPTACWYLDNSRFLAHWTIHGRKVGSTEYGWADEVYILPWVLYRYYGDTATLQAAYPAMQQLIAGRDKTLASTNATWRDHLAMKNVPGDFFAACYQCYMYKIVSNIASVLGNKADSLRYRELFGKLCDGFNEKYLDEATGVYEPYCQTGAILPLALGLVPEGMKVKVAESLNRFVVEKDYHPTTGLMATPHLLPLLCDFGYADTAQKLALQTTFPSWGFILNTGATTITESWWGHERGLEASMNHYIHGSIGRWFFEYLGGIRLDPEINAFKRFILKPVFYVDQSHVSVSYQSRYGEIKSSWLNINTQGRWRWTFTIPKDTTAMVHLPGTEPEEYEAGTYAREIPYPE